MSNKLPLDGSLEARKLRAERDVGWKPWRGVWQGSGVSDGLGPEGLAWFLPVVEDWRSSLFVELWRFDNLAFFRTDETAETTELLDAVGAMDVDVAGAERSVGLRYKLPALSCHRRAKRSLP